MVLAVQSRQSYEFLSFLLANGADPYLHHGRFAPIFPAAVIIYRGASDAVAALGDWGVDLRGRNLLVSAVGRGYGGLARYLLGRGVRPENDIAEDNDSNTPVLHLAARDGDVDMVRLLLEYGVADIKDDKGTTAVQVAEEMQYLHIAQLLRA